MRTNTGLELNDVRNVKARMIQTPDKHLKIVLTLTKAQQRLFCLNAGEKYNSQLFDEIEIREQQR